MNKQPCGLALSMETTMKFDPVMSAMQIATDPVIF